MADPRPPLFGSKRAWNAGRLVADPLLRSLAIFAAGMALLLCIDLGGRPTGTIGEDRAIETALAAGSGALSDVAEGPVPVGEEQDGAAERRERAQSTVFFLEQAHLAWRRGDTREPQAVETERAGAALLAFLGKLWVLGWLLLPVGALAARLACPRMEGRPAHWASQFAATSLGIAGALTGLALAIYTLGVSAPWVIAPLITAIVVLNAWLLREHARLDRAATLLRLAPLLVILTVALMLAREILLRLAILP